MALEALAHRPKDSMDAHAHMARRLFEEIRKRAKAEGTTTNAIAPRDLVPYVAVLCQTGASEEAREPVAQSWRQSPGRTGRRLWWHVLRGLAREENDGQLQQTLSMMDQAAVPFDAKMHQVMTVYYASRDDVVRTRQWYERPIADGEPPTHHTNSQVLSFCVRNDELDWGGAAFAQHPGRHGQGRGRDRSHDGRHGTPQRGRAVHPTGH